MEIPAETALVIFFGIMICIIAIGFQKECWERRNEYNGNRWVLILPSGWIVGGIGIILLSIL